MRKNGVVENRDQSQIVGSIREFEDAEVGAIPRVRQEPLRGKRPP
jgi:hypothetical protein